MRRGFRGQGSSALPLRVTAVILRRASGKRGSAAIGCDVHAPEPIEAAAEDVTSCAQEAASRAGEVRGGVGGILMTSLPPVR